MPNRVMLSLNDIEALADKNCKKKGCYGRGWTGQKADTEEIILCDCVRKNLRNKAAVEKRMQDSGLIVPGSDVTPEPVKELRTPSGLIIPK